MSDFLPYIINGVTNGSIYAIAALGLVLTYKTSGIFNFAHGAVAAGGAYLFYELWQKHGMPWPLATVLVVLVFAPIFGVLMEQLARRLATLSTAAKIVATVGLLVGIQGLLAAIYGSAALQFPHFLPTNTHAVGELRVSDDQFITMAIALASAVSLYLFFRNTRLGLSMRAVVDNPELLDMTGVGPARVRILSWMIGSSFAALSGVLIAPTIGLDAFLLGLLVVQAFGAAAVGSFSSLPLTYIGGLAVGIGAGLATKYVGDVPFLAGFPPSFPFIVLFVVLLFTPRARLVASAVEPVPTQRGPRLPLSRNAQLGGAAVLVALLLAAPLLVGARLPSYTNGLTFVLLFASLGLLVRTSGQVSLCHMAFAAVGASSFSHLSHAGVPWLLALLLASLLAVPIGAVVAIPAIRLSRLYLALATFGFGVLLERLVYNTSIMFGQLGVQKVPRPDFAHGDKAYYYVVLAAALLGLGLVFWASRSRLGRLLQALSDSPTALSTLGIDVNATRVIVFCISAFLAALAGALAGGLNGTTSTISFSSFTSLLLLPVLYLAGTNQLLSPVVAAFALAVLPVYFTSSWFSDWQPVIFGLSAVLAAIGSGKDLDVAARVLAAADRRLRGPRYSVLGNRLGKVNSASVNAR
ncbi:MAG: hypothetical protein QOJ03_3175 [Frankiaceae bacterium]|jgi:branched-subunit amino acid ABC-type transport system permease component|nr:hypothetical protein [Frankiaceae bacterium]